MRLLKFLLASGSLWALVGCVTPLPYRADSSYRPVLPNIPPPTPVSDGSLFTASHSLALFDDQFAVSVGDIVTIRLEESTQASKSADTSYSKATNNEILNPRVFGSVVRGSGAGEILNSLGSTNDFTGSGASDQSNSLTGTISAVVAQELPNGLLLVQGEKWFKLNRGEEFVRISGLLRREDIAADNSVSSQRLADARIAYSGTGVLAQSNQAGWLSRFLNGVVNPF